MWQYRVMPKDEPVSISIKLSPTQVDEVVRAASRSRAPSISTLIADTLNARPLSANGAKRSTVTASWRSSGYMPIGAVDPRLSRSLLRGLSILTCFGPDGGSRGIVEIAEDLGMSPSTTHRYALTLVELGLLERCPDTRKYRLAGLSVGGPGRMRPGRQGRMRPCLGAAHARLRRWRMRQRFDGPHAARHGSSHARTRRTARAPSGTTCSLG